MGKAIILKERENSFPLVISKEHSILTRSSYYTNLEKYEYIGRSFKAKSIPLVDPDNITVPIINIRDFYKDHSNAITSRSSNVTDNNSFSFASYYRYIDKSSSTKKVNNGFSLDLGVFSIGAKNTITNTFASIYNNEKKSAFGQFDFYARAQSYELYSSFDNLSEISCNYLTRSYINELYNNPHQNLLETYGSFALCGYSLGGRLTALYAGNYKKDATKTTRERDMKKAVDGTYKIFNGNIGFGRKYSRITEEEKKFLDFRVSIRTLGGKKTMININTASEMSKIDVDCQAWIESLNDKSTHELSSINDNGLISISDLLLEANFKHHIEVFNKGGEISRKLIAPYILITYSSGTGNFSIANRNRSFNTRYGSPIWGGVNPDWIRLSATYVAKAFIVTRYGDYIPIKESQNFIIKSGMADINNATFPSPTYNDMKIAIEELKKEISPKFGLEIKYKHINSKDLKYQGYVSNMMDALNIEKLKKYYNSKLGLTYWLYNEDGKKYGFSIYDNYILNTYAFKSKPTGVLSSIDYRELVKYTIIGL